MIVGIKGRLASSTPVSAVVEAGGLFYEVNVPLTTSERLPASGSEVMLHTLAVYREDSQSLYGFISASDRDFFKLVVEKVSGIGPKIALNMMSRMSAQTLQSAIASGDAALLSKCQGIGKKTAERLVLELRGAFAPAGMSVSGGDFGATEASAISDAVAALCALGMKPADSDKLVRQGCAALGGSATVEQLVKYALSK